MKPKVKSPLLPEVFKIKKLLRSLNLHTVCEEASCPNIGDCFSRKTATFMIMGDVCTRNCPYCNVNHGKPLPLNPDEPENIAKAVKILSLKHVVITSVDRDDLPDGGASHFAKVIEKVRQLNPDTTIEVLIPDFKGNVESLKIVVDSKPDVINHNVETVKQLYKKVRPQGNYERSLKLIKTVKELDSNIITKSGFMLGLGETKQQVINLLIDLKQHNCDVVTIGQYLQPSKNHLPVEKYYTEEEFKEFEDIGYKIGFKQVFSGILVRSSFHAGEVYEKVKL
ncbi:lipoyl synthase [Sulfurihydrogenibium azorense]|jgi:lipoic acid synthetase|uniref:Lipoyl synthase n=1 Tax=Sulfurihydrogenibium azorense (strain DSM 15241 / OCM 825 / Az-Fu1) TaxID=204536 RepID=C1DWF9_SULAA|nr:lipoyl synthase [Sulfurihydrogenibium azorense]ACN99734.1 lipoyl synthase [Sulfurihydrogenibium azorense Az-Fu1]MDM7273332.1 lipoyl synthase [Sulfurihydrogenibium azorense]